MGIVSSTFASLAIRFAWNCQRFFDPRYRYIEPVSTKRSSGEVAIVPTRSSTSPESVVDDVGAGAPSTKFIEYQGVTANCLSLENNHSLHQENRRRRAAQHRYRKRPSSFDVSLIIRNKNKTLTMTAPTSGLVTHSTPSTLKRQPAPSWDSTSSSGSSSDSDSEPEFMYAKRTTPSSDERLERNSTVEVPEDKINERGNTEYRSVEDVDAPEGFAMSAAEEAAFRMTVGRGHFSRSKKDKYLNHLRLEKRLNGLNKEFFDLACRAHKRSLQSHHSGESRKDV